MYRPTLEEMPVVSEPTLERMLSGAMEEAAVARVPAGKVFDGDSLSAFVVVVVVVVIIFFVDVVVNENDVWSEIVCETLRTCNESVASH